MHLKVRLGNQNVPKYKNFKVIEKYFKNQSSKSLT